MPRNQAFGREPERRDSVSFGSQEGQRSRSEKDHFVMKFGHVKTRLDTAQSAPIKRVD
jgi:hypothetical protein